ncbi:hypothetical protein BH24CHL6_BH24CHL6_12870 [soil metagenome]
MRVSRFGFAGAAGMALVLTAAAIAVASDANVAVADTTTPTDSVELSPGDTAPITLKVTVAGAQAGTSTYKIDRDWTLKADGTWSSSNAATSASIGPRGGGDAANIQNFSGSVSVHEDAECDTYTLAAGVYDITNTNSTGAKLNAGSSSDYEVVVSGCSTAPDPDTTAPVITITAPVDGATYLLNQVVEADFACSDNESTVTQCQGTVDDGSAIDTSTVGRHTFRVDASSAGGSSFEEVTYYVGYNFAGFSRPVDNGVLNVAKAGQAIPFKWRLTDANGDPVLTLASVKLTVASLSCDVGSTEDALEEYATGSSGLQNLGDGYYQFNWATPKTYASSCKTAKLDLGEGSTHNAQFKFNK